MTSAHKKVATTIGAVFVAYGIWAATYLASHVALYLLDSTRGLTDDWSQRLFREWFTPGLGGYVAIAFVHRNLPAASLRWVALLLSIPLIFVYVGVSVYLIAFRSYEFTFSWIEQISQWGMAVATGIGSYIAWSTYHLPPTTNSETVAELVALAYEQPKQQPPKPADPMPLQREPISPARDPAVTEPDALGPYVHGYAASSQVSAVQNKIDSYLNSFGTAKPKSLTLSPYDWALLDLMLRKASGGSASLHTHAYNDIVINCQAQRCYCHGLVATEESKEIVKQLASYSEIMKDKLPTAIPLSAEAKQRLNVRFDALFDGALNVETDPQLALQLIRVAGALLNKASDA